jgi:hypothetical protein
VKFTVVSTGIADPARCVASVQSQIGVEVEHVCLGPPKSHFENLLGAISDLHGDRIVASLDLDDWLIGPRALATVAKYYEDGAMCTYGSFVYADGRPGHAAAYAPDADVRKANWLGTHLKTFRAHLFQSIRHEDLKDDSGEWLVHARDLALMFPILEMCGLGRSAFVPEPVYVYNFGTSTEFTGDEKTLRDEREAVKLVRGRKPYDRCVT